MFRDYRKKMSKMPSNVELILNPLTAAPGFRIENVYVLPGVPEILKIMFKNVSGDWGCYFSTVSSIFQQNNN